MITSTKLYDNIIFLENIKQGFKRTISSNNIDLSKQHKQQKKEFKLPDSSTI